MAHSLGSIETDKPSRILCQPLEGDSERSCTTCVTHKVQQIYSINALSLETFLESETGVSLMELLERQALYTDMDRHPDLS
jgi:hypothetical protein